MFFLLWDYFLSVVLRTFFCGSYAIFGLKSLKRIFITNIFDINIGIFIPFLLFVIEK